MSSSTSPEAVPTAERPSPRESAVVAAVACGGAIGAVLRAVVAQLLPHPADGIDAATLVTNLLGCALLGALVAVVARGRAHPLLRPFVGVGMLGGFTTFSTYAVHECGLIAHDRLWAAVVETVVSVAGGLVAAWLGARWVNRRVGA